MPPQAHAGKAPPKPLRILIVRVGALGDVLHAMPAVALLRQWVPNAWIGWAVDPRYIPLLQAQPGAVPGSLQMPLVNFVHPVEASQWSKHPFSTRTRRSVLQLRRDLRRQKYDAALDLQGSIRSALIARMSGARIVTGSDTPREAPARWLYRQTALHRLPHVIQHAAEIVQAAIAGSYEEQPAVPPNLPKAPLPVDAAAEAWCDALLGNLPDRPFGAPPYAQPEASPDAQLEAPLDARPGVQLDAQSAFAGSALPGTSAPVVFMAPTAGWGAKQWPVERFAGLARKLAQRHCHVLVNASPPAPDHTAGQVVTLAASPGLASESAPSADDSTNTGRSTASSTGPSSAMPPPAVTALEMTLPQLIALLRRVALVVAGDTGPIHLAAALDRPVVALFGPTDPVRTGPFATPARVLRHSSSVTDHRRHSETEAGLAQITVDEAFQAADYLLGPGASRSAEGAERFS